MHRQRRFKVDLSDVRREGLRYVTFYRGHKAFGEGWAYEDNPHPPGSEEQLCWQFGWEYAATEDR